jgi:alanine dehydrogenase
MIIGILKEIKEKENRVAMTPAGADLMKQNGHTVLAENNAGKGSGFQNVEYIRAGAEIVAEAKDIFARADMIMHVKEPLPQEYDLIKNDQIVFTFLHLAAEKKLTEALIKSDSVSIAYETIQKKDGSLPLLKPMSEIAGRMSIHQAAKYLETSYGGSGVLIGGVPGVKPATVLIVGGGTVGINAAKMASGLGALVYIFDKNQERLRYLNDVMPSNCFTLMFDPVNFEQFFKKADVIIGGALIPGAKAPKLITRDMLKQMKKGSVLVDVSIDQGGCFETSKPTTHTDPIYTVDGIIHYCVANMPGAVAKTSTMALTNATLPYALEIANKGWRKAMIENEEIKAGANIVKGKVTYKGVSEAFGIGYADINGFL